MVNWLKWSPWATSEEESLMAMLLKLLELNMVLFSSLKQKKKSLKRLVTILLIYTLILCIICDPQHRTSNLVSALKPDMDKQFSYDSYHREKHLAQPLKAGYVWRNLKQRPDGFCTLTQPPPQSQDASRRQHSPMSTEYLKMWTPPLLDDPPFSLLSNVFSSPFYFPIQEKSFQVPEAESFTFTQHV